MPGRHDQHLFHITRSPIRSPISPATRSFSGASAGEHSLCEPRIVEQLTLDGESSPAASQPTEKRRSLLHAFAPEPAAPLRLPCNLGATFPSSQHGFDSTYGVNTGLKRL